MKRPSASWPRTPPPDLRLGVVGAGEVGGAGEQFHRHRCRDRLERRFGGLAGGDILRLVQRAPSCARASAFASAAGRSRRIRRSNSARLRLPSSSKRACQSLRAPAPRLPAARQAFSTSSGTANGFERDAELFLGARELVGAERLAMGLRGAGARRRAVADGGLAGDQRRLVGLLRARRSRRRSPSDRGRRSARRAQPADLKRFTWSTESASESRAVDRDAVVVVQHDQLVQLQVAGQRDRFLRTPSIRSPSEAST